MSKLKPVVVSLCLLNSGLVSVLGADLAFAAGSESATDVTTRQVAAQAEKLQEQMQLLQEQIALLQNQQKVLLKEQQQLQQQIKTQRTQAAATTTRKNTLPTTIAVPDWQTTSTQAQSTAIIPVQGALSPEVEQAIAEEPDFAPVPFAELDEPDTFVELPYGDQLLANIGGTAVISSPFIHSRYDYQGSGLITNYSSVNKDVAALRQRRDFVNQMGQYGLTIPSYPIIELSGQLEGEALAVKNYSGSTSNDINLTTAELDIQALINQKFTGFMSIVYDKSPAISLGARRVSNSNLYIENAFMTYGDLNESPFYATLGQVYVPFGQYSSYLVSDPFPKTLFRTLARPLVLGYQSTGSTGPYAAVYAFRGDTREGDYMPGVTTRPSNSHIHSFGGNLGYAFKSDKLQGSFGASIINNVTDAAGMQRTGAGGGRFGGFASSTGTEVLSHRVPGIDLRAFLEYDAFAWITEYATATRAFSPLDLTYNGHGAKPSGFHTEGVYSFAFLERASSLVIGYDHSREALALNVPENRYAIGFNISYWPSTLLSLEYSYSRNYSSTDTASGSAGPVFTPTGKNSNAVVAHFDVYF